MKYLHDLSDFFSHLDGWPESVLERTTWETRGNNLSFSRTPIAYSRDVYQWDWPLTTSPDCQKHVVVFSWHPTGDSTIRRRNGHSENVGKTDWQSLKLKIKVLSTRRSLDIRHYDTLRLYKSTIDATSLLQNLLARVVTVRGGGL